MAILESIGGERECPCRRLVPRFKVSKRTISHHMKQLDQAGLTAEYLPRLTLGATAGLLASDPSALGDDTSIAMQSLRC